MIRIKIIPRPRERTVDRAAPFIPISGKGPMPKISSGSRIALIIAESTMSIPGVKVSPVALTILFPITGTITNITP